MISRKINLLFIFIWFTVGFAHAADDPSSITIGNAKIKMTLDVDKKASISSLTVDGKKVISETGGVYSSVKVNNETYSSLHLKGTPILSKNGSIYTLSGISYGGKGFTITEKWIFAVSSKNIRWTIQRTTSKPLHLQEAASPVFNFDSINTWEGAYQGYGGLAWFYL